MFSQSKMGATPRIDKSIGFGWLAKLASEGEIAAAKLRVLSRSFETAKNQLLTTGRPVTIMGKTVSTKDELEDWSKLVLTPMRAGSQSFIDQRERQSKTLNKVGWGITMGASAVGGYAENITSNFSASGGVLRLENLRAG